MTKVQFDQLLRPTTLLDMVLMVKPLLNGRGGPVAIVGNGGMRVTSKDSRGIQQESPINSITDKVLQSNVCLPLSPAKGDVLIMNLALVALFFSVVPLLVRHGGISVSTVASTQASCIDRSHHHVLCSCASDHCSHLEAD